MDVAKVLILPSKKKKSKTAGAVAAVFGLFFLALTIAFFYLGSPAGGGQSVIVKIAPQSSTGEIAALLKENDVIHSAEYFKVYTHFTGADRSLKPGKYSFRGTESLARVVTLLREGSAELLSFTVPEGYTIDQVANLLDSEGFVSREEFLSALKQPDFKFTYLAELPEGQSRFEGFLFPDTYTVSPEMSGQEIVQLMLDQFEEIYTPEYKKKAQELGMSDLEVITLASIIEREAKKPGDRPLISAVFHNRLKEGMLLQSCATVQYALGEVKPVLNYSDLQLESPYNTYLNLGLPPGPIASPGAASIKAALFPAEASYLYFVAKPDGSHVFSNTLEEHNEAKRKYIS